MCGIAGLFVACPLEGTCPKLAVQQTLGGVVPPCSHEYRSKFVQWDARASVRAAPRRELGSNEPGDYFPAELVAVLAHPELREVSPDVRSAITIHQLYRYLNFTIQLEQLVVNRVVEAIAHRLVDLSLPEEMIVDAYKIYCDEAYHAYFSYDMAHQVRVRTGILPLEGDVAPYFLVRLRKIQDEYPDSATRQLLELFFVIVSETLISGLLKTLPSAKQVKPSIRALVKDHAVDEGRHHVYFARLLEIVWPRLAPPYQAVIAQRMPDLIHAFLAPDLPSLRLELLGYGLRSSLVDRVLGETYTPEVVEASMRTSTRDLMGYLECLGVLQSAEVQDRFCAMSFTA
jgi:hypothetical protein